MKALVPYTSVTEALPALDNGGRFYNWSSKANDGEITEAEVAKTGQIYIGTQKLILYLEMMLLGLSHNEQQSILNRLSPDLTKAYRKYQPKCWLPSQVQQSGVAASNAIVTGIPKLIDKKSEFQGFIMIPIAAGSTTVMTMIPLIEAYNVYELRDEATSETFIIAHTKQNAPLPEQRVVVGGILKKLKSDAKDTEEKQLFLEVQYHIDQPELANRLALQH
ncbi:hypothetical protein SAMN05216480_102265 [Pustulibacterium marinum]|uniref:Uncharacterized protein n=1 Tax=Pustulibacterium marinum TaxID=1224947 RepID=A0A1I7FV81_9FLAO|nr:hypothetical protein [Pustulibacterium marinum]SFU40077.1 hypothetical protein SAMN05216480_102265 [Pustulibacterium marinum]